MGVTVKIRKVKKSKILFSIFLWIVIFLLPLFFLDYEGGDLYFFYINTIFRGLPLAVMLSLLLHFGIQFHFERFRIKEHSFHIDKRQLLLFIGLAVLIVPSFLIGYNSVITWLPFVYGFDWLELVFLITHFIGYFFILFIAFQYGEFTKKLENKWFSIKNVYLLCPLISYGYILSEFVKSSISRKVNAADIKRNRGIVINRMNYWNLIVSALFVVLVFSLITGQERVAFNYYDYRRSLLIPLICIIFVRATSRSCEILFAFYMDSISDKKASSNLTPANRIGLALFSLIEIMLLFSTIYWLLEPEDIFYKPVDCIFYSIGIGTMMEWRISEMRTVTNIFSTIQLVTCMVLIVFSIARYFGSIKKKTADNEEMAICDKQIQSGKQASTKHQQPRKRK